MLASNFELLLTKMSSEVCELLISSGSTYAVKLMHNNNSELIAFDLSVNFNWPPEESDCSCLFSVEFHWQLPFCRSIRVFCSWCTSDKKCTG